MKPDKDYINWLNSIKEKILTSQLKAASVVNNLLIEFYWELGNQIVSKQRESKWGDKIIDQLSKDLQNEFIGMSGLSKTNLKYCKRFYLFYNEEVKIGQQAVDQLQYDELYFKIPWGHNILIFTKTETKEGNSSYNWNFAL